MWLLRTLLTLEDIDVPGVLSFLHFSFLQKNNIQKKVSFIFQEPPRQVLDNPHILLIAEILHQLRLVVYPIIYRVLYTPGGAGFLPSTVGNSFIAV